MNQLHVVAEWLLEHPETASEIGLFLLYWARGIMPRKPPKNPFLFALWQLESKALALPWDRWLGKPHIPGKIVPPLFTKK